MWLDRAWGRSWADQARRVWRWAGCAGRHRAQAKANPLGGGARHRCNCRDMAAAAKSDRRCGRVMQPAQKGHINSRDAV